MAAGELRGRLAHQQQHVARLGELGGDAAPDVGDVGDGSDDERRRDGVPPPVGAGVLVVQRVLAGDERGPVGDGRVVAAAHGGDELAEGARAPRVAPREVVEQRHAVGIGADGDDVADRLVDDGVGHRLGVVQPVPRVDADAHGDAVGVAWIGEHDTIAWPVTARADERPDHRAAADLVVVAVDGRRLGSDVAVGEQAQQRRGRILDAPCPWRAVGHREVGGHPALRPAVVEEGGVEVEHDRPAVAHDQPAVTGEGAEVGELDTMAVAAGLQLGETRRRHGEDHPLLGLGQPDLPRRQARVLERDGRQLDVGAGALGHLPDRRRQAAGTAVGDRCPQVVGAGEHVDQQLLGDGVTDLHAGAGDGAGGGVHRGAGERCPADAVAAGASAEDDDPVAGGRAGRKGTVGGDTEAAAEDQRVRREAGVVEDRSGDRRQPDLVAVVGHAVDHAVADAGRMQGPVWQLVERQVGRTEAQHVGDGDGPVSGAHHVPDHTSDTRVGAAERLDRGGVVVGLGLEGDGRALAERHDAGVADERRAHERSGDRVRRLAQLGQQRRHLGAVIDGDRGTERLVRAVLAPRLGQGLQLDVGRVAPGGVEVDLDGEQLLGVEGERTRGAEPSERVGREAADRDRLHAGDVVGAGVQWRRGRARGPVLDDRVGDEPPQQHVDGVVGCAGRELDAPSGGRRGDRQAELSTGVDHRLGGAVGDAGVQRDLDPGGVGHVPGSGLQQRVGEEVTESLARRVVEVALDEDNVGDRDGTLEREAERRRAGGHGLGAGVGVSGSNREPTDPAMTWRHWPDPTGTGLGGPVSVNEKYVGPGRPGSLRRRPSRRYGGGDGRRSRVRAHPAGPRASR